MTTRWGPPRAAWSSSPTSDAAVEETEPAGSSPAGAGRQTGTGAGRLQRPAEERQGQRRHATAGIVAYDPVSARKGCARRPALAPRQAEGWSRPAVLAE